MNNRLKNVRKALGLTQEEFAKRINTSKHTVESYENNRRPIPNVRIDSICHTFHIDKRWFKTGEGNEMFTKTKKNTLEKLFKDVSMNDDFKSRFILSLSKLNADDWKAIEKVIDNMTSDE